jgi:hypothetical protein
MTLYGLLNPLRFDADITLCCGGAAVLQEMLQEDNIIAVGLVVFCCVQFTFLTFHLPSCFPRFLLYRQLHFESAFSNSIAPKTTAVNSYFTYCSLSGKF